MHFVLIIQDKTSWFYLEPHLKVDALQFMPKFDKFTTLD